MRSPKAIAISTLLSQSIIASGLKQTPSSNLRHRQTDDAIGGVSSSNSNADDSRQTSFERNLQGCAGANASCQGSSKCCDGFICSRVNGSKICLLDGTPPPTTFPTQKPTTSPTKSPTYSPTNPQTSPPTTSPITPSPTSSPITPTPTRHPVPVTCLCCFNSPGFGDYFNIEKGGYLSSNGIYGDGELFCTAAFLNTGPTTLNLPLDVCEVNMLVIGGGGGGGGSSSSAAGGGGAGEFIQWGYGSETLSQGTYSITVGEGGAGGFGSYVDPGTAGSNGGITSISNGASLTIQANGGGGGGGPNAPSGKGGGSGGGAHQSNPAGQSELLGGGMGNAGGLSNAAGGGGGGASGPGQSFSGPLTPCYGDVAGNGGPGVDRSSEFGLEFGEYGRFAGGGGGGASSDTNCPSHERKRGFATDGGGNGGGGFENFNSSGEDGTPNSGGGGGAAGGAGGFGWGSGGGNGGSGIVLIRFKECSTNVF